MQCQICHESRGRMRVHMDQYRMTMAQADQLEYYLYKVPGITDASVNDRTANAVIRYEGSREDVILALAAFDYETAEEAPEKSGRAILHEYEERLAFHVLKRIFVRLLVPMPMRRLPSATARPLPARLRISRLRKRILKNFWNCGKLPWRHRRGFASITA